MNLTSKKILLIDLEKKESEVKTFTDIQEFIGGMGLGLKLMQNYISQDPVIFSIGPFNGFFPYASKTSIVLNNSGVIEDLYVGGSLSTRLKFTGVDAVILINKASEELIIEITNHQVSIKPNDTDINSLGLPGRKSKFEFIEGRFLLDDYFKTPERLLDQKMKEKNVKGIVISGTENYKFNDISKYEELYKKILNKRDEVTINSGLNPSCSNCPLGCVKSIEGELGGNVLLHSLVACQYSEKIYSDIGIVFSCLDTLGYNYTHEDLENLPGLIEKTLKEF